MRSVWQRFWNELNTPSDFSAQPYYGALNQVGHIAIGREVVTLVCIAYGTALGTAPNAWAVAVGVVVVYLVVIEMCRQKWVGADTIIDTAFLAIGASYAPLAMQMTPSGRWIRAQDASTAVACWIGVAVAALALYVYPRARRLYSAQGHQDPAGSPH